MISDVFDSGEMVRIVDALLDEPGRAFNKSELSENAEVSRPTLYRFLPRLENLGIITSGGKQDGVDVYRLNMNSFLVRSLIRFDNELSKSMFKAGVSTPDLRQIDEEPSSLSVRLADWAEILGLELPKGASPTPCGIAEVPSPAPKVAVCCQKGKPILAAVSA